MKIRKILLLFPGIPLGLFALYIGGVLGWGTMFDFQPPSHMTIAGEGKVTATQPVPDTLRLLTWNIGYAGLGAEMDFFYDGGKQVKPKKEWHEKYLQGILKFLQAQSPDFILLQEVDTASARSYYSNEYRNLHLGLKPYEAYFALNYQVDFVPTPIFNPMGKATGGLATYSKFHADTASRFDYPGDFSWPKKVFLLDRCMLLNRLPAKGGKSLVIINTHNSAYDQDGTMKRQELAFIKQVLLDEYKKGNYVIVGGDWNQAPPFHIGKGNKQVDNIPPDYLPEDWIWAYDPTMNTNRSLAEIYQPEKTATSLIDFFVVSPNVQILKVKGHNLHFENSDHNPVSMEIALK